MTEKNTIEMGEMMSYYRVIITFDNGEIKKYRFEYLQDAMHEMNWQMMYNNAISVNCFYECDLEIYDESYL